MTDSFSGLATGKDSPAEHCALVTPSDSTDLTNSSRALLCSGAVVAKLTFVGGETVENVPLQQGYNPLRISRVWSTGTTLGSETIHALW